MPRTLYHKIGCLSINVVNKSIEEAATIITESLPKELFYNSIFNIFN